MPNLTKAYFDQDSVYYSVSGDKLIKINNMAPQYAANATRRLLMDAPVWAMEADIVATPAHWMHNTKLFKALCRRAVS